MIRKVPLLAWAPAASMLLMIVAVYSSWAVAYGQLGRHPRPSIDDPKFIGGFSTDVYTICVWLILVLAAIWALTSLIALVMGVLPKTKHRSGWWLGFAAGLIAFGVQVPLLRNSPGDAIEWFAD